MVVTKSGPTGLAIVGQELQTSRNFPHRPFPGFYPSSASFRRAGLFSPSPRLNTAQTTSNGFAEQHREAKGGLLTRFTTEEVIQGRARGLRGDGSRIMSTVKAIGDPGQSTFLSLEEAGLVEMTGLDMHEKFLARLTVSSLNLLKEISEQEGVPIEELNAGKLCDWFVRDKEKRQKNIEEATLKWNTPEW